MITWLYARGNTHIHTQNKIVCGVQKMKISRGTTINPLHIWQQNGVRDKFLLFNFLGFCDSQSLLAYLYPFKLAGTPTWILLDGALKANPTQHSHIQNRCVRGCAHQLQDHNNVTANLKSCRECRFSILVRKPIHSRYVFHESKYCD